MNSNIAFQTRDSLEVRLHGLRSDTAHRGCCSEQTEMFSSPKLTTSFGARRFCCSLLSCCAITKPAASLQQTALASGRSFLCCEQKLKRVCERFFRFHSSLNSHRYDCERIIFTFHQIYCEVSIYCATGDRIEMRNSQISCSEVVDGAVNGRERTGREQEMLNNLSRQFLVKNGIMLIQLEIRSFSCTSEQILRLLMQTLKRKPLIGALIWHYTVSQ